MLVFWRNGRKSQVSNHRRGVAEQMTDWSKVVGSILRNSGGHMRHTIIALLIFGNLQTDALRQKACVGVVSLLLVLSCLVCAGEDSTRRKTQENRGMFMGLIPQKYTGCP